MLSIFQMFGGSHASAECGSVNGWLSIVPLKPPRKATLGTHAEFTRKHLGSVSSGSSQRDQKYLSALFL